MRRRGNVIYSWCFRTHFFLPPFLGNSHTSAFFKKTYILHWVQSTFSCVQVFILFFYFLLCQGNVNLVFIIKFFDQNTCLSFPKGYSVLLSNSLVDLVHLNQLSNQPSSIPNSPLFINKSHWNTVKLSHFS